MSRFRTTTEYWVRVKAKFLIDSNGSVDKPSNYHAVLYDKNPITKNRIASEFLGRDGSVAFEFPLLASIRNNETPFESKPDLFLRLFKKDKLIYTSRVFKNVDFFIHDDDKRRLIHNTINLGKFRVKVRQPEDHEMPKAAT